MKQCTTQVMSGPGRAACGLYILCIGGGGLGYLTVFGPCGAERIVAMAGVLAITTASMVLNLGLRD